MPDCLKPKAGDVMFVDVGVYGHSELPDYIGKDKALRRFEQFTLEHEGFQALYAETLMTKDEFTEMFPREIYDKVCKSFNSIIICNQMLFQARKQFPETAQAFPEVFDKVSRIGRAKTKIEEKKEK